MNKQMNKQMNKLNINTHKRIYIPPRIECIELDNKISLALESTPAIPSDGDEVYNSPYYFNSPYKSNLG